MKTWQMIKELTENPEKKFKQVGDGDKWVEFERNRLVWKGRGQEGQPFVVCSSVGYTWEEVKESISFEEVLEAVKKDTDLSLHLVNETHKVSLKGRLSTILSWLRVKISINSVLAEILTDGEWYIED